MAEGQYRRLECARCSSEFEVIVRAGNQRRYCSKACKLGSPAPTSMACAQCAEPFTCTRRGNRFCSIDCRKLGSKVSAKERYALKERPVLKHACVICERRFESRTVKRAACSQECRKVLRALAPPVVRSSYEKRCIWCERPFTHAMSNAIYCSKLCKSKAWISKQPEVLRRQRERVAQEARATAKRAQRIELAKAKQIAAAARDAARLAWQERCCKECGQCITRPRAKSFCSIKCSELASRRSPSVAAAKKLRKQLKRGANGGELFSDFDIFERDGWRCQICGISTPKQHHASNKWTAPELDHIVPVTRGGTHTRDNVQCLCRRCNNKKSNGPPAGQIGLFTGLLNEQIKTGRRRRQPATT